MRMKANKIFMLKKALWHLLQTMPIALTLEGEFRTITKCQCSCKSNSKKSFQPSCRRLAFPIHSDNSLSRSLAKRLSALLLKRVKAWRKLLNYQTSL